jgi:hypothetical protein
VPLSPGTAGGSPAVAVTVDQEGQTGRLSRSDAERYAPVSEALLARRLVATCGAWLQEERAALAVKLDLAEVAQAFAAVEQVPAG